MVIWITGLSGAGKTTFAKKLYSQLKTKLPQAVILDGDSIRQTISNDLAFDESARKIQIGRVQRLAKLLSDQGLIVIVAVVYAHPNLLRWNRDNINDYFEVYLKVSLDIVRARDTKGLYGKAESASSSNVVGVDIKWHEPVQPDIVFDQDSSLPPKTMVEKLMVAIPKLMEMMSGDDRRK